MPSSFPLPIAVVFRGERQLAKRPARAPGALPSLPSGYSASCRTSSTGRDAWQHPPQQQ